MSLYSDIKRLIAEWMSSEPFPPELVFACIYIARYHLPYKRFGKKEFFKRFRLSAIHFILREGWKVDKAAVEEFLKLFAELCDGLCRDVKCISSSGIFSLIQSILGADDDAAGEALATS